MLRITDEIIRHKVGLLNQTQQESCYTATHLISNVRFEGKSRH